MATEDKCGWCQVNSGRTHANRECCKLRRLAQAPRGYILEYVKTLTEAEKTALRADLIEEKKRLKESRK